MIGIPVTKESSVQFLECAIEDLLQLVRDAAKAQQTVGCAHLGNFEKWVRRHESKLAHLEELLSLVERLKPGTVLREAEVEAGKGRAP